VSGTGIKNYSRKSGVRKLLLLLNEFRTLDWEAIKQGLGFSGILQLTGLAIA